MNLDEIRKDLSFLRDYEVVLFGSVARGEKTQRSDIDVAVITRIQSKEENKRILKDLIGRAPPIYDIKIFELLPLKIKASVMDEFVTVFGEAPEISYYFYHFRKIWEDCRHRIMEGYDQTLEERRERKRKWEEALARIRKKRNGL